MHKIKITNGEVIFKKYNRKLRKECMKLFFAGSSFDPSTGEMGRIPAETVVDMGDRVFELIVDKIVVNGNDYQYKDLDKLNEDGLVTDDDWDLCETEALKIYTDSTAKKKKTNSEQ